MDDDQLIAAAAGVLRPRMVKGRLFGDVGAAVLSRSGRMFLGVSVDTPGWGLCAERGALATMVAAGEYALDRVVAVWKDPNTGCLHILPPCGICREFMRSLDDQNLSAEVVLGRRRRVLLRDLLPAHDWPQPDEGKEGPR